MIEYTDDEVDAWREEQQRKPDVLHRASEWDRGIRRGRTSTRQLILDCADDIRSLRAENADLKDQVRAMMSGLGRRSDGD